MYNAKYKTLLVITRNIKIQLQIQSENGMLKFQIQHVKKSRHQNEGNQK